MVTASCKTVVVLGLAYGGACAARALTQHLPKGWRIVCIDRNTHFNHLYVLPRFAVVPGHEYKAFIPYSPMLDIKEPKPLAKSVYLHARVTSLTPQSLTLSRAFPEHGITEPSRRLGFDFAIYALGSHLPAPINLWGPVGGDAEVFSITKGTVQDVASDQQAPLAAKSAGNPAYGGTKPEAVDWLKRLRVRVESASSILVVGGGPLGVQYSTDIKERHPGKHVTLLHSRTQLVPGFTKELHDEIMSTVSDLGITPILGDRLDLDSMKEGKTVANADCKRECVVRTVSGREIRAELILLCTGQVPNTDLLAEAIPDAIISEGPQNGQARVARTMQVAVRATPRTTADAVQQALCKLNVSDTQPEHEGDGPIHIPHPNFFAVGDAVDGFGADKAGRSSAYQARVAAKNVLKLIERSESSGLTSADNLELDRYQAGEHGIKMTLGIRRQVIERDGKVVVSMDGVEDLRARSMWQLYGVDTDDEGMHRWPPGTAMGRSISRCVWYRRADRYDRGDLLQLAMEAQASAN